MKTIRRAFALFLAWLNVRSIEIEISDVETFMREPIDQEIAFGLSIRRTQLNNDLAAARAIYHYFKNQDSRETRLAI